MPGILAKKTNEEWGICRVNRLGVSLELAVSDGASCMHLYTKLHEKINLWILQKTHVLGSNWQNYFFLREEEDIFEDFLRCDLGM